MPEASFYNFYSLEPSKHKPVIKQSGGIGDTDGFPAFDVDSDAYAAKDDPKWGFLITGGAEFHMPLTVFQVTSEGLADKNGIRLGDIILEINEEDATQLTLAQAHEKIELSGKKLHLLVKSMDDDEQLDGYEPGEEKSIVMRVPKPMQALKDFTPTPLLGSRCWHPIMWQDPPKPPEPKKKKTKTEIDEEGNEVVIELSDDESSDEEEEELPHHRIINNIRRFFNEVGENAELKNRVIEDMLLALPVISKTVSIEQRLREMQRKLSEIAEIPKILSSTLATVSETFDKLMPTDGERLKQLAQRRKFSYDEDAIDYELSDEDYEEDEDDNVDDNERSYVGDGDSKLEDAITASIQRRKHAKVKEITPESDYASEAYYPDEEINTAEEDNDDDDIDDDNDTDDYNGNYVAYNFRSNVSTTNDDSENDFLTTSYTWNLRNIPKLKINDDEQNDELKPGAFDFRKSNESLKEQTPSPEDAVKQEKQEKLDKLERSWPWADRQKIIYKQSTCHLVPRKPLGLVEKRIQLLAKQHLADNIKQISEKK